MDDDADVGEEPESDRFRRDDGGMDERFGRLELTSDRSVPVSPLVMMVDERGLSFFPPGIFERSERKDRVESFVSERLKDG